MGEEERERGGENVPRGTFVYFYYFWKSGSRNNNNESVNITSVTIDRESFLE